MEGQRALISLLSHCVQTDAPTARPFSPPASMLALVVRVAPLFRPARLHLLRAALGYFVGVGHISGQGATCVWYLLLKKNEYDPQCAARYPGATLYGPQRLTGLCPVASPRRRSSRYHEIGIIASRNGSFWGPWMWDGGRDTQSRGSAQIGLDDGDAENITVATPLPASSSRAVPVFAGSPFLCWNSAPASRGAGFKLETDGNARGVGGAGGVGHDKGIGGDGGAGHGPTLNFYSSSQEEQSEFRTIRLGDIKLRKQFRPESYYIVDFKSGLCRETIVRRVYSGEIRGDPGPVTVTMYEGDWAEERWRQDVAKYAAIRHPYIMQLYGLVNTRTLRAMVFHDELIPFRPFRRQYSPVLNTYILGYCTTEFDEAIEYLFCQGVLPERPRNRRPLEYNSLSLWIRPTTGDLCLDLTRTFSVQELLDGDSVHVPHLENVSLDDPNAETMIVSHFDEDEYHELCSVYPNAKSKGFAVSTELSIQPVPVIFRSIQLEPFHSDSFNKGTLFKMAEAPDVGYEQDLRWDCGGVQGNVLPNSWTRYDFCQGDDLLSRMRMTLSSCPPGTLKSWVAQANHIFAQIQAMSHLEDYVCPDRVVFHLELDDSCRNPPQAYLFVCPPEDFRAGGCPAYWSLDPSGVDRLSPAAAKTLGFPTIHIQTVIYGRFWDVDVYEGLRRFHQGKGFDPDSQDLARHLGYPLFELSSGKITPLEYGVPTFADWLEFHSSHSNG
ncbi:hypothetical protein MSAN_01521200 [Mycena sanguinolenta]|uniref:Uncharacterized protein n=1 Tax=Mycena sanguinolenta TaxID=230812 RepID=A0A8H6Y839_9AGAR|nr:hypothetical protein MSAN_01521200 [Mycena sanguinolenta]